ncbi:MarR family winged helix-turn-helix transcriptional regulator [Sphingomonas sp. SUN039]|uniref:MarR family winged helix-turn-helix transcriptional regulator n=1 Tax=Sphingomonas sp. SUN039 TaxID=2937787 RepID=UPI002164D340|nr:MarR family transcriptional regulator [Sphingomonas sp. SUN039]UVO54396.1 MarR family transcriptional regulator [Sphingomonas sp. SUN039]
MNEQLARSGLHQQIGFALRQASSAVWSDLVATLAPFDLRPQVYATLLIVEANAGCKQQDIADALGIHRPNLVALVDDLVARNLIERSVNAADRRSYSLVLTDEGKAHLDAARAAHKVHEGRIAKALGSAPHSGLIDALTNLAKIGTPR